MIEIFTHMHYKQRFRKLLSYVPFFSSSVRRFSIVLIIPIKAKDRNDEMETKQVWNINFGLLIMKRRLIFSVETQSGS